MVFEMKKFAVVIAVLLPMLAMETPAFGQSSAVTLNFVTVTAPKAALGAPIKYQMTAINTGSTTVQVGSNVTLVAPDNTTTTLLATKPTLIAGQIKLVSASFVTKTTSSLTGTFTLKGFLTDITTGQILAETDIPLTITSVPANGIYASIGGAGPSSALLGYTSDYQYVVANLGTTTQSLTVNTTVIDPSGKQTSLLAGKPTTYNAGTNTITAAEVTTTQYASLTGNWKVRVDVLNGATKVASDTFTFARNALSASLFPPNFTDKATSAGISVARSKVTIPNCSPFQDQILGGSGATIADYDGDGYDDVFVTDFAGKNHLWHNNGNTTFTDMATAAGIPTTIQASAASFGDVDNDGHPDLVILYDSMPTVLLHNNGNGTFTNVSATSGLNSNPVVQNNFSGTFGDYDGDGFLDLYITVHADCAASNQNDHLFHNNGNGTFTDVTSLLGGSTASQVNGRGMVTAFLDYNGDGRPDLYVGNDEGFQPFSHPNVLWRNDGSDGHGGWKFTDVSATTAANVAISCMGIAASDYNRKGQFNMFMTNVGNNVLLQLGSNTVFSQLQWDTPGNAHVARTNIPNPRTNGVGTALGVTWASGFYDFNNDGWEDLYVAGGNLAAGTSLYPSAMFVNNQDGTFLDLSVLSGTNLVAMSQTNATFADFDHDGYMDIFTIGITGTPHLFMNNAKTQGNPNHWLEVTLVGTTSNKDGVGAKLSASVGGATLLRRVINGGGYQGNSSLVQHFGLGSATIVDSLTITWPNGSVQTLSNVAADQRLTVTQQ